MGKMCRRLDFGTSIHSLSTVTAAITKSGT